MYRRTPEEIEANWQELRDGPWLDPEDPFNTQPRPKVVCQLGFLVVELGERQRKCRGCGVKIFKGTYHITVGTMDSMASLKFCQQCIESAAGWCKVSNRRNL